jgi:hypothetical protein
MNRPGFPQAPARRSDDGTTQAGHLVEAYPCDNPFTVSAVADQCRSAARGASYTEPGAR